MTLILFKFCLPALLGYTLFVGIAGRLNPFNKPYYLEERPSWLLGIWTSLCVTLVLTLGLQMAYGMSLEGARALFKPSAWLLGALMIPGFIAYFVYRRAIASELSVAVPTTFDWAGETAALSLQESITAEDLMRDKVDRQISDALENERAKRPIAEDFADSNEFAHSDTHKFTSVLSNDLNNDSIASPVETVPNSLAPAETEEAEQVETEVAVQADATYETVTESVSIANNDSSDQFAGSGTSSVLSETEADLSAMQKQLDEERELREEIEQHLRITRKALSVLESESRDYETAKAEALISLEEELENRIKLQSASEARATREETKRISVETSMLGMKQDLVKAKQEVRKSTAARAKALSTANKSIAFARQAVQIRARLEQDLRETQEALKNRQATISSLIRALEKEKRRTQDEVTLMAKQLVLHEKQLSARRSLEEVARSVEGKLTSRLVKKVAKAKPLTSDQ